MFAFDFNSLVESAREDQRVLGLVLTGSRGRSAFVRHDSDWDVRLVVRDEDFGACEAVYDTERGSPVEVAVFSLSEFEQAGELGTPNEWDRYSYVHAELVLDKDGRIAEVLAEKSSRTTRRGSCSPRTSTRRIRSRRS
jgi:hypothetical protein